MRTTLAAFFLIATAHMGSVYQGNAQNLPPFGELPDVGKQWQLRTQGNAFAFHWVVLTNAETSDVLSFASYKLQLKPGQKQNLIYLTDTAHEIFPGGDPVWPLPGPPGRFSNFPIWNGVVKLEFRDRAGRRDQEALQYTFIHVDERKHGTNQMAHGYAVVFDGVAVFVQHTSKKPITFELAYDTAIKLLESHHGRLPAAAKPEPQPAP